MADAPASTARSTRDDAGQPPSSHRTHWRVAIRPIATLAMFGLALWMIDQVLADYRWADIRSALAGISPFAIGVAIVGTAAGYLALVGYDVVAFRIIGQPTPLARMLAPSFVSFAVSNSAPASVVTAGGVRYRLYAERGISPGQAAAVAAVNVVTYALGLCAVAGLALLARPVVPPGLPAWLDAPGRVLGTALLIAVATYFGAVLAHRRSLRIFGRTFRVPTPRLAAEQLVVSAADWLLSSGVLYVLLMGAGQPDYLEFVARFLVAQFVSLVVPIPGGLGVFEAVVLYLTATGASAPHVLAALVAYRAIYYLLPLLAAGVLLLLRGIRAARASGRRPSEWLVDETVKVLPHVLSFTTFLTGGLLLVTGTIPANSQRLAWLARILPLPFIEASHFLASVIGAALLIVAWGLEERVRSAYRIARLLFGAGIVLTLMRALDLRLALGLSIAMVILLAAGRSFPRTNTHSLLRDPFPASWIIAIGAALLVMLSAGRIAYRDVDYSGQLWWRFTIQGGDAPRALRALVGTSVTFLLFALARYFARRSPQLQRTTRARPRDAAGRFVDRSAS